MKNRLATIGPFPVVFIDMKKVIVVTGAESELRWYVDSLGGLLLDNRIIGLNVFDEAEFKIKEGEDNKLYAFPKNHIVVD